MAEIGPPQNNPESPNNVSAQVLTDIAMSSLVRISRRIRGIEESVSTGFIIETDGRLQVATAGHNIVPAAIGKMDFEIRDSRGKILSYEGTRSRLVSGGLPIRAYDPSNPDEREDWDITEDIGAFNLNVSRDTAERSGIRPLPIRDLDSYPIRANETVYGAGFHEVDGREEINIYAGVTREADELSQDTPWLSGVMQVIEIDSNNPLTSKLPSRGASGGFWIDSGLKAFGITVAGTGTDVERNVVGARVLDSSARQFFEGVR